MFTLLFKSMLHVVTLFYHWTLDLVLQVISVYNKTFSTVNLNAKN